MYKITIPISLSSLLDENNLPKYLDDLRKCGAKRVFIGGIGNIYMKTGRNYTHSDAIKRAVEYFKAAGLEVGIWLASFGNGHALSTAQAITDETTAYTQITGINGESREHLSCCPMDKNFVQAYCEGIRTIAALSPDLIMIDDDFRFNNRINIHFACFCPLHLAEFYRRVGKEIPREELEELLLTGGKNIYRSEILKLFGETLLDFAKAVRSAVNEVNPAIRLGFCTHETWDMHGTDPIEVAKTAAGNTKPFARISGAPFRSVDIIRIVEYSRQQYAWGKGSGVELFSEGDTFPRPRHRVPSKPLELFEQILLADGTSDGILAYIEDYDFSYAYERGYVERFVKNRALCEQIKELFNEKTPVGVEVFNVPHKAENWELPKELHPQTAEMLVLATEPQSHLLLSVNSIPTSFSGNDEYPLFLIGENARYVDISKLKKGAILDVPAAKILAERGVDTGLIEAVLGNADSEYFNVAKERVNRIASEALYHIKCQSNAETLSTFSPSDTPASYRYENACGQRFYVLAADIYRSLIITMSPNFLKNYCRQADLAAAIEWIAGKPLPAFTAKHSNLYVLASKGEGAMSVALANVHLDDVFAPEIKLDRAYNEIRFVNCTGTMDGDRVTLSDIPPYGFVAFEVK